MGGKSSILKTSTISSASRVMRESSEAKADMADLEKQTADETQKIRDQYDPAALTLEAVKLTPVKKKTSR
jgi:hypothetical protein